MTADPLVGQTCVVTGATGGIGRAIVSALILAGATVCAVGRRRDELEGMAAVAAGSGDLAVYPADLVVDNEVATLGRALGEREGGVDVLVHSAGTFSMGDLASARIEDFDRQYTANARAPYLLTQALVPTLRATRGQIVFINSTAVESARAEVGQFAATQHALKALADAMREELNPEGIRVTSVYVGRTATSRQAAIHEMEGRAYSPERLLQPEDVASVVLAALTLSRSAELTDVKVRPMLKH